MLAPIKDSPVTKPLYSIISLFSSVFADVNIIFITYFINCIIPQITKKRMITPVRAYLVFFCWLILWSQTVWQSGEHTSSFKGIGVPQIGQCLCGSTAILSPYFYILKKSLVVFVTSFASFSTS